VLNVLEQLPQLNSFGILIASSASPTPAAVVAAVAAASKKT
jgi:hypothetical protein